MAKKSKSNSSKTPASGKPSSLIDTRVIYCGDNLEQLKKFPDGCVDLIYIDPPFNSNRNYEVFWGETKETTVQSGELTMLGLSYGEWPAIIISGLLS